MNPGELNKRITIMKPNGDANVRGFKNLKDYIFHRKIWSGRRGLRGREFYAAKAVNAETNVVYTIRYCTDITGKMIIVDGDETYKIESISDTEGKREKLTIHASKVVSSG